MRSPAEICLLLEERGHRPYADGKITQVQHALQTATLAQEADAHNDLICAALLHDIGHLLDQPAVKDVQHESNDLHHYLAIPLLEPFFGPAVLEPIRLHVHALRYRCAVDLDYLLRMSALERMRLYQYGGVLSPSEAAHFSTQTFAQDALQLQRWDDMARVRTMKTPSLAHFVALLESSVLPEHCHHLQPPLVTNGMVIDNATAASIKEKA